MSLVQKFPFLASSVDPTKISLRVKTALYMGLPVIVFFAQLRGWDIGEEGIKKLFDYLVEITAAIAGVILGIQHVYAWVRALKKK